MKLETIEEVLINRMKRVSERPSGSPEALNSLSNAVQALLMVRQEIDRQKALNQAVEPEKVIVPKGSGVNLGDIK